MGYEELDDIRFDEIFDYDNRDGELEDEREYTDNKYYLGLSVYEPDNLFQSDNYLIFASNVNISTFYQFPIQDIEKYLNDYRCIGPKRMLQPEIMKMKFIDSDYNCPIYTVTNKTFWLRLVQRTWKKIYKKRKEFIQNNIVNMLHKREIGQRFILPNIQGMLSYLKDNKYKN